MASIVSGSELEEMISTTDSESEDSSGSELDTISGSVTSRGVIRKLSQSSGVYKHSFISEPDGALQCVICLEIAVDPWQHNKCGRLLCGGCLEKYGRHKPCPNCRMRHPQYFDDNKSNPSERGETWIA